MTNPLVLVVDSDPKNLQILKENLEASGFSVITLSSGNKAWEEIQQTRPQLVLTEISLQGLTGYQLLERLKADPNTKSIPLIFLTNQREIQQRVRAFELGAKDYLVKPLHVKEVIAHIRMVLRRLERRKTEQLEAYMKFSGRLDQLNLADLIESFGVERKTGVLTLSNGKKTGQVYFRNGAVINASLGDLKQEAAIYQMFPWKHGYFNIVFRDIDVADEISVSNLGLLLHGIKRMEIREKLLEQLSSPKTSFTITPTFKMFIAKRKISSDITNFVNLLDGKRDVEQIIDDSGTDDLVTLKRIVRLYQQGFIKPTIPPVKKPVLRRKIEHDEDKIEFFGKSIPIKEVPPKRTLITEKTLDDDIFEIKPREKPKDLEDEIKPIFERIENERKRLLIPEDKEKSEEQIQFPEEDEQRLPEEVLDEETEITEQQEEELTTLSDQIYIDEELLRQSSDVDDKDRLETPFVSEELEPPVQLIDETIDQKEAEMPPAEQDFADSEIEIREISRKADPVEQQKHEFKKPAPSESMQVRKNIIIVSVDDDCKDELMDILTGNKFTSRIIEELDGLQLDVGKIKFDDFSQFNVLAISVDKQFHVFLKSIKQKMCGFIFAVECSQRNTWEYTSYLIHSITVKFKLPYAIAVMNFHEQNAITMDVIRYQLNLDESVPMIAWDAVDKSSIRKLLGLATISNSEDKLRKPTNTLDSFIEKIMM